MSLDSNLHAVMNLGEILKMGQGHPYSFIIMKKKKKKKKDILLIDSKLKLGSFLSYGYVLSIYFFLKLLVALRRA